MALITAERLAFKMAHKKYKKCDIPSCNKEYEFIDIAEDGEIIIRCEQHYNNYLASKMSYLERMQMWLK